MNILDAIDCSLMLDELNGWTKTENSISFVFETSKGLDGLERVQANPNQGVYNAAINLLSKYFEVVEEVVMNQGSSNPANHNSQMNFQI